MTELTDPRISVANSLLFLLYVIARVESACDEKVLFASQFK